MSASRTELLGWLNELLALNYTKVEQCGTGAAYAQIIDSIYGKFFWINFRQCAHVTNQFRSPS